MRRGALLCLLVAAASACAALPAWAQTADEPTDTPAAEISEPVDQPPRRRVRRLGDMPTEDYDLELAPPPAPPPQETSTAPLYNLPDAAKNQRLQSLLATLAVREGDPQALAELDRLLAEVIDDAYDLMDQLQFDEAAQLLSVVRNIDPRQEGLKSAQQSLASRQVQYPYLDSPPPTSGKKLNTVESVSPYRLPQAAQTRRLDQLLTTLAVRPGYAPALRELNDLLDDVLDQAGFAMEQGEFEQAEQLLGVVRMVNPRKRGLAESRRRLEKFREVDGLLRQAAEAERRGFLIEPLIDSAYYYYRKALAINPESQEARRGLMNIQQVMVVNALDAARNYDFELAEEWLEQASDVRESQELVEEAREEIFGFRAQSAGAIEQDVRDAIGRGDFEYAEFRLIDLIALGGYEDRVAALREMITSEEVYGQYEPGQVIQDPLQGLSGLAPPMMVIGSGSFLMGAPAEDRDRRDSESPLHRVRIDRGFAMAMQEITVGQFRTFVRSSGYRTDAEHDGNSSVWDDTLGRLSDREAVNWRHDFRGQRADDDLPVLRVSWNDAQAYVRWLTQVTGQVYRLPTEAEFEFAQRAGVRDRYWWGDGRPRETVENLAGEEDRSTSGRRFSKAIRGYGDGYFGPAPAGRFIANPWGLFDMAGNVSEWVQDCWHSSYLRAPADGSAWENPGCTRRVVRGGYWASSESQARSSARNSASADFHASQLGFRVVREL